MGKKYSELPSAIQRFIRKKVKDLGSYEDVESHYYRGYGPKDIITRFALSVAREIYKE